MVLRKHLIGLILITSALLTSSCTKETTVDCFSGLRLQFDFTHHNADGSLFGPEVQRIRVYLFDEQGILQLRAIDNGRMLEIEYLQNGQIKQKSKINPHGELPEDYVMELDVVNPGAYKIMAWGGSSLTTPTYFDAHMNDPVTHDFRKGVTVGQTTMADFRMFVDFNEASDLPEDIVPVVAEIDDLWYGAYGDRNPTTSEYSFKPLQVKSGEIAYGKIDLMKNTNIINFTVSGIEYLQQATAAHSKSSSMLGETGYKAWVISQNGRYKFDNSIGEYARSIRYTPYSSQTDENTIVTKIKILRLDMNRRSSDIATLLYFETPDGRRFPTQPIRIVSTLLNARDDQGNYLYQNQADLDKIYEHPIEVKIGYDLQVRIFTQGWEIINVTPI